MSLIKNMRFLILLALMLISIYLFVSPYLLKSSDVVISSLDKNASCSGIKEGDSVTQVTGYPVKSAADFERIVSELKAGNYITLVVNNRPNNCYVISDGNIGIDVSDVAGSRTTLGMEFQGGTRFVFKPENTVTSTELKNAVDILNKRVKYLGLLQTEADLWGDRINITTPMPEKVGMLTARGILKGIVIYEVKTENNTGKIFLGDTAYSFSVLDKKIKIVNVSYEEGELFKIEDVDFAARNVTNESVIFEATFLENGDVASVLSQETSGYDAETKRYEYSIPVEIKNETSDRFIEIVKKIPITKYQNTSLFNALIRYYFDDKQISQLNIPSNIISKEIKVFSIIGIADDKNEATNEMLQIDSALRSGELPTSLSLEKTEAVKPTGVQVLQMNILLIVVVFFIFIIVARVMFKNLKVGMLIASLIMMELISVVGIAIINQSFFGIGWLIDSVTLSGFIILMLIVGFELLMVACYDLKIERYRKMYNKTKYLSFIIVALGICLLFSSFRNLGLVIFFGELLNIFLIKSIFGSELKKFVFVK